MTSFMNEIEFLIERIKLLASDSDDKKDYLRKLVDNKIASVANETSMGVVPLDFSSQVSIYASARIAIELLDDPQQITEKPEGIVDLYVLEWLLRPAIPYINGKLEAMESGPWCSIDFTRFIEIERSVCRIDVLQNGQVMHCGSGFAAGTTNNAELIILSNAHVVEYALHLGWTKHTNIDLACNFMKYAIHTNNHVPLQYQYKIHDTYDLAILTISDGISRSLSVQHPPLKIASHEIMTTKPESIAVIGHPSFNSDFDPFPKLYGFGTEFGIKRFSPGKLVNVVNRIWRGYNVPVLLHDATTLSGSSGSCIIDLDTLYVIGIHFGGWPKPVQNITINNLELKTQLFEANGGVPLWKLKEDSLLQELNFQ